MDAGPNPWHGKSFPTDGMIALSEKIDSLGKLENVVWIRNPRLFRETLNLLSARERLDEVIEINWDVPLYAVFLGPENQVVFAGRSDRGRCFFYPAKASVNGSSVRILSVDDGKRRAKIHAEDAKERTLYRGIPARSGIEHFEAILAKEEKAKAK
jgi:hypothetical protein